MKLTTLKPRLKELAPKLKAINGSSWRAGKTTAERGYGAEWQRARIEFLRENPLCSYCERRGQLTRASVVDHIQPHKGDQLLFWRRSNWQALCKPCHDTVKPVEEGRARRKVQIGLDGWPVE